MTTFSTLLVANRGEIALRVMRTAKALGMRTVAVYSDADANAPHVKFADEAVYIGASPVGESYLRGDRIIEAAKQTGAEAIHPGYGFLSENAGFANAVKEAGLIFVGPPVNAIEVMGDKAISKRAMIEAGVPCVPGYQGEEQDDARLLDEAGAIGFPLMVKAAAGGGGRGMRLVHAEAGLASAISLARSEAINAFGSGDLIIEKAIISPRHVEIQVFADSHGNVIHLGERDCSVQRRHQKVVEEAPCPVMTPELRDLMGNAAVEAARAVNYVGAGTVEFLLDSSGEFYFLEMNTRLQVEHPVTEMITGLDLVALQLRVAQGEPLNLTQQEVTLTGHAIEVRLYAEDPDADFLPSTGPIKLWQVPELPGIRVDAGIESGGEVSPFYDSMVAKIIAYGDSREQARQLLLRGLEQTALFGTHTNRDFLIDSLSHDTFAAGKATTAFIAESFPDGYASTAPSASHYAIAAVLQYRLALNTARSEALEVSEELLEWSSVGRMQSVHRYAIDDALQTLFVQPLGQQRYAVGIADQQIVVEWFSDGVNNVRVRVEGRTLNAMYCAEGNSTLHLAVPGAAAFTVVDLLAGDAAAGDQAGSGTIAAPMHGVLLEIMVHEGDTVTQGQAVAILEAMKMQHEIRARAEGTVTTIAAAVGSQLAADDLIMEIEPSAE